jgi:hypothetical protein
VRLRPCFVNYCAVCILALQGCLGRGPESLVPRARCLADSESELWVTMVRQAESYMAPGGEAATYLIRGGRECRQVLGVFARAFPEVPDTTSVYAVRTGDRGFAIIVPSWRRGEWTSTAWFSPQGELRLPLLLM